MIHPSLESAVQKLWTSVNASADILKATRNENHTLSSSLQQAIKDKDIILEELRRTRDEMNKIRQDMESMSADQRAYSKLAEQYQVLESHSGENLTKLSEALKQLTALTEENNTLKKNFEDISVALAAKDTIVKRVESLESENTLLSQKLNEMLEFEKNLEIMRKELARKNADVNHHLNEIQKLKNERAEAESKLFDIPKQKEEIASLKVMIDALTQDKNELLQTHEEAKEYSRLHKVQQESIDTYTQQILDLKRVNSHLETDKADRDRQIESLQRKIDEQLMVQERLHLQLRSAREYEQQIAEQLRSLDDYSAQLIESQKTISQREEELTTSKSNERELQQLVQKEQQSVWLLTEKLNAVNASYEKLLLELSELKQERETSREEITLLRKQSAEFEEKLQGSELQRTDITTEFALLQKSLQTHQQSLSDLENQRATLTSTLAAKDIELTSLYGKNALAEENISELRANIEALKSELYAVQMKSEEEHSATERGRTELTRTIAELELLNNSLVATIHTLEHELLQTKEALIGATSDLDTSQKERDDAAQSLRHSIEMMKHEMSEKEAHFTLKNKELETRLRAQELLFDQVSSEKQTIELEKAEITATLNKLRDERDEYLAQISELVGEKNNSQERTTTTIERLQKEIVQEKAKNSEAKEEIADLKVQIHSMVKQLEEENANAMRWKEQMIHLTRERSSDELLLHQKEKSIQELSAKLTSLTASLSQYSQQGNEHINQLSLNVDDSDLHNELVAVKRKMSAINDEINFVKSEKKSALAQVSSLAEQLKIMSEKLSKQDLLLEEVQNENKQLKENVSLSKQTIESSEHTLQNQQLADSVRNALVRLEQFL
jgi:chromosome segregation ATPase